MPKLISRRGDVVQAVDDAFTTVADGESIPTVGDVIVSLARFQSEGEDLLAQGRRVGVFLAPDEAPEVLAYDLPRISVIALIFPKFRDGRPYSTAHILRETLKFSGELRAVGDVLLEQVFFMTRCGFDAFAPADGSQAEDIAVAARRYRHVYQRAADAMEPAFVRRAGT